MGDKFYNIVVKNATTEPINFATSETSFEPVLVSASEYTVGVKRFKLPLDQVDAIRIYEGTCFLGVNVDRTDTYHAPFVPYPAFDPQNLRIFDLTLSKSRLYAGRKRDPVTGQLYVAFSTQQEFVNSMNAMLHMAVNYSYITAYTVTASFDGDTGTNTPPVQIPESTIGPITHSFQYNNVVHTLQWAAAPDGLYSTGNFANIPMGRGANAGQPTELPSYHSRKLLNFALKFTSYNYVSGLDLFFSSVEYFVAVSMPGVGTASNTVVNFCICKGAFPGLQVSQMATYFPQGFGFTLESSLDPRTYDWQSERIPTTMVLFRPYEADRMRDELLLSFGEYNLVQIAATTRVQVPPNSTVTTLKYDLEWSQLGSNTPYWVRGQGVFGEGAGDTAYGAAEALQAFPRFQWDASTNKIALAVSKKMVGNGVSFYTSPGLQSILGFETGRIRPYAASFFTADTASAIGFTVQYKTSVDLYEVLLNSAPSSMTLPAVLPNAAAETLQVYSEPRSSVWAREFLWGIQIISNSLSISGEFSGEGKEKEKILSDFEVDPSGLAGARDYLLYQPQGNSVRFFEMQSDAPLSIVQLRVTYKSKQGHSYPLMLGPSRIGTVKIEFRKK